MKSLFSRFLHHTLSYSGLTRISRSNKVANFFHLDTPVKPECDTMKTDASLKCDNDSLCTGRSMVEMLGVLAIIGVLSVGAIAGYSKAMMKYKLNKHAEAINMLINNVLSIKDKLPRNPTGVIYYNTLLSKLNLLPDGIVKLDETILEDKYFNNNISITYSAGDPSLSGFLFWIGRASSDYTLESCYNIIKVAKENAANVWFVRTYKHYSDGSGKPSDNLETFYGDAYCNTGYICLRNITLNNLEKACQSCKDGHCSIGIFWK